MSNSLSASNNAPALAEIQLPDEIRTLLGKPPLLEPEDPNEYHGLLMLLGRDVKPSDVVEWLWVRDVADLTWDIMRYRRIKTTFFNQHFRFVLERDRQAPLRLRAATAALDAQLARRKAPALTREGADGGNDGLTDSTTKGGVDANVEARVLDPDRTTLQSFSYNAHLWESLEKMQTSAELRRNNTLREIEHRRSALGRALRQSSDQVIEAEVLPAPVAA
jgi:hypothetical protein